MSQAARFPPIRTKTGTNRRSEHEPSSSRGVLPAFTPILRAACGLRVALVPLSSLRSG